MCVPVFAAHQLAGIWEILAAAE